MKLVKNFAVLLAATSLAFISNENVFAGKDAPDNSEGPHQEPKVVWLTKKFNLTPGQEAILRNAVALTPEQKAVIGNAFSAEVYARPYESPFLVGSPPSEGSMAQDILDVVLVLRGKDGQIIYRKPIGNISRRHYNGDVYELTKKNHLRTEKFLRKVFIYKNCEDFVSGPNPFDDCHDDTPIWDCDECVRDASFEMLSKLTDDVYKNVISKLHTNKAKN